MTPQSLDDARAGFPAAFVVLLAVFLVPLFQGGAMAVAIAACALHSLAVRHVVWRAMAPALILLALPLWALISTLWSQAPPQTLYSAARLLGTALIAFVLAGTIPLRTLLAALAAAGLVTMLTAFALSVDELIAGAPITSAMGNHNLTGARAALTILASIGVLLDARQPGPARMTAIAALLAAIPVLHLSRSAGSLVMTLAGVAALIAIGLFTLLPRLLRGAALATALLVAPLAWFAAPTGLGADVVDSSLSALGRERTLTRRTHIWERARPIIEARPVLGHGFRAFANAADTMRAAHLHSEILELWVGLGLVGVILFALMALAAIWGLLTQAVLARDMSLSCLAAIVIAFCVLAAAEYYLTVPFHIFTLVFYMACAISIRPRSDDKGAPEIAGRAP